MTPSMGGTEAERRLLSQRTISFGGSAVDLDPVTTGESWGADRTIRAEVLQQALLTSGRTPVIVRGARISGSVVLASAEIPAPFFLEHCRFEDLLVLDLADAGRISLSHSLLVNGLSARGLRTRGNVALVGATSWDGVWLAGADIGGTAALTDARLEPSSGPALVADHLQVRQDVLCSGSFQASGRLRLPQTTIGGSFVLSGAELTGTDGWSVDASGAQVGRDVQCQGDQDTGRAFSSGPLYLLDARIGGSLNCSTATVEARGEQAAILADRVQVGAGIRCRMNFKALGAISLQNARIHGDLDFTSADVAGAPMSLIASGAHVDGNVFLRRGFSAAGCVNLAGAHVGGQLSLLQSRLSANTRLTDGDGRALNLQAADIGRGLILQATRLDGILDLSGARTITLNDEPDSWPSPGNLRLDKFHYEDFGVPLSVEQRLDWLSRNDRRYVPQAFDELAAAFTRIGDEDAANAVLIEKQRVRRYREGLRGLPARVWSRFLDVAVGYGYHPARGFAWLLVLWLIGSILTGTVFADDIDAVTKAAREASFQPVLYTLDLLLPVASLGQRSGWAATGAAAWFTVALTIVGWLLGLTLVAAITGVFRRD